MNPYDDVKQLADIKGAGKDHLIYSVPLECEPLFMEYLQWLFDEFEDQLEIHVKPTTGGTIYTISLPSNAEPVGHYSDGSPVDDMTESYTMDANELDALSIPEQVVLYGQCVNRAAEQILLSVQLWHRIKSGAAFMTREESQCVSSSLDVLYATVKEIVLMERGKK